MPFSLVLDVSLGEGSGSLTLLILYVVLAIGVSFLCSIMEAVLLSVTPAYVGALESEKPKTAGRLKELKTDMGMISERTRMPRVRTAEKTPTAALPK